VSRRYVPLAGFALPACLAVLLVVTACGSSTKSPSVASAPVYRFGVVGTAGKVAQLELNRPTPVSGIRGRVVQIATSNSDGYARTSDGAVWAWGVGSSGELGDGQTPASETTAVRVAFPAGTQITALANPMPFDGALAIDAHGQVWGWGLNADGDLCLPGGVETTPQRLTLSGVTLATGARTHSLFDSRGRVYACGTGSSGELGNGSTTGSPTPTPVVGLPADAGVTALTSSWAGSGALLSNGTYYNWGYNAAGQMGDGTTTNRDVPVAVRLPAPVRQVFQGGSGADNGQTVAILADGSVWSWGNNQRGQLGNGTRTNSNTPVRVSVPAGATFVTVNSGGYSSYAIDQTGRLWAWGGNQNGQLGTGTGVRQETRPVNVSIHVAQVSSTASNVASLGT
jgi:alpha-tubulin suppressor-like RCC1 family protein